MKYKRLLTLALAAALCIVAAACGTKANAPGADTPAKTDTPTAAPGGTQTVGDTGDGTVREGRLLRAGTGEPAAADL